MPRLRSLWTVLELHKRDVITVEQQTLFDQITPGRDPAFGTDESSQNHTALV